MLVVHISLVFNLCLCEHKLAITRQRKHLPLQLLRYELVNKNPCGMFHRINRAIAATMNPAIIISGVAPVSLAALEHTAINMQHTAACILHGAS